MDHWQMYHDEYVKFLPYINNNYDFQELLSEILGELNASHTGGRYSHSAKNGDETASLGLLFDETYTGNGIKVSEVLSGGPIDNADSKIKRGAIILKINNEQIEAEDNWNKYLNNIIVAKLIDYYQSLTNGLQILKGHIHNGGYMDMDSDDEEEEEDENRRKYLCLIFEPPVNHVSESREKG